MRRQIGQLIPGDLRFRLNTKLNHLYNVAKYDYPPDPYHTIQIDPAKVKKKCSCISIAEGLAQTKSGNWDKCSVSTSECSVRKGLRQRFVQGLDWRDTEYFQVKLEKFERKGEIEGYESIEHFVNVRCDYVDRLYRDIKREGYRPNYEGCHKCPKEDIRANKHHYRHSIEPLIAIGREGEMIEVDGVHRLVIADILDISQIPVNVIRRHQIWQEKRDRIFSDVRKRNSDRHMECPTLHPDLRDLIYES